MDSIAEFRDLKARFDAAHREGMEALTRGDYARFGDAIRREREVVTEHAALLAIIMDERHAPRGRP